MGVNGVGKIIIIGKFVLKYKNFGKKVFLGVGDIFRVVVVE